jgi:hypothetical protein
MVRCGAGTCPIYYRREPEKWWFSLNAKEPSTHSSAKPEPKVHYRLCQAVMLLFQGFAPNPTYFAPKRAEQSSNEKEILVR